MSEEHRALGYRPPPGSLAAQAQAAIARHETQNAEEQTLTVDAEKLKEAAVADAKRIKQERANGSSAADVDLDFIGEAEARKIMSDEHKALGYRPPPGSLAAEAQAAAAKHPYATLGVDPAVLARAALEDASHITSSNAAELNVENIGEAEARILVSEEHRALGYRPPRDSLAATAQAAAAKHPATRTGVDSATLAQAALKDAKKINASRMLDRSDDVQPALPPQLSVATVTAPEARALQSEEQKALGYRPPAGSAAALAQSAVDARADVPVSKAIAAEIASEEHKARGHLPESGTVASVTQSLANRNERDGGERTLGDVGL